MDRSTFDKYFTIEVYGSKGWEVIWYYNSLNEAINKFREEMLLKSSETVARLTSPTDTSIYVYRR
jgi:uncharacterized protein (DUF427 family)